MQIAPIVLRSRKNSFEPMVECALVQPNCEFGFDTRALLRLERTMNSLCH